MKKLLVFAMVLIAVLGLSVEVALIAPAFTSTFHVTVANGAEAQAEEYGWTIDLVAPQQESDYLAGLQLIESMLTRGVQAMSVNMISMEAMIQGAREAGAEGVPYFIHNSLVPLPEESDRYVTAYVGYDQRKAGRQCAAKAVQLLIDRYGEAKGQILILQGIPGYHTTEREGGFREIIELFPDIEIVASQPADWLRDMAMSVTENVLQAYPDLDVVFGCSDAMAQGAGQAALAEGKEVYTIGIDGNPDAFEDIKKGILTATAATQPYEMGAIVVRSMKKVLDGEEVPHFIVTPTVIVDLDNVDNFM